MGYAKGDSALAWTWEGLSSSAYLWHVPRVSFLLGEGLEERIVSTMLSLAAK